MSLPNASEPYLDPYKNFRFRVKWDGRHIAGVSKVSGLRRTTEVAQHREGGADVIHKSPGPTNYEAITLERGLTRGTEFEDWANRVRAGGAEGDFRKDIVIEVYDEAGQLALAFKVYRCWVSEYQALPELDAGGHAVTIEQIKLENEGWERDREATAAASR
jgi:phage tail-like protein